MLGEFPESNVEMQIEPDGAPTAYRWSRRAMTLGFLGFSAAILVFGVLALLLLGIPIALITGLVEGNWQATEQALAQLWRLSPLLLAAEFVLTWVLVALFLIVKRMLAKYGITVV